jgi:hypothetical protein
MRLILRQYLASLKERGELDAILPDLLGGLGFHVYSRPQRGTTQHGVDVAAFGKDEDQEEKVFLFSVKSGDLKRQDWDGTPQSLRPSLNEILDAYIPTRIPAEYAARKIVICLCFGGDLHEQLQDDVRGYIRKNTTSIISFQEWNGERLAGLLLKGILREELLPKGIRASFQKAVAMVDSPDVSYRYFSELVRRLTNKTDLTDGARVTVARQLNICLWVTFVWAREVNNMEAPHRISELVTLRIWDLSRSFMGQSTINAKAMQAVLGEVIELHLKISFEYLENRILPHVAKLDGLSAAVSTRSSTDVNLKLFEVLGRLTMAGIWLFWIDQHSGSNNNRAQIESIYSSACQLIQNNKALLLPLCDIQSVEVSIFLLLSVSASSDKTNAQTWLEHMANLLDFTVRTHGKYPCIFTNYRDLIEHPRSRSEEYRSEATTGSTLIPLVSAWLGAFGSVRALEKLASLMDGPLKHCTLQFWLPDTDTDAMLYVGDDNHGTALTDISIKLPTSEYITAIADACRAKTSFDELSAVVYGYWPLVLLACRHYRLPVPPHFWIFLLQEVTARAEPAVQDASL